MKLITKFLQEVLNMANKKKSVINRIFSAMMAAAVAAATVFSAMPLTSMAEYSGGIIDDTDGKFYAVEATGEVSEEWDGTTASGFAGGIGTEADPFQIANGRQLAYLASQVNSGMNFRGAYFKLTADILLNDDLDDAPTSWNPIGEYYYNNSGDYGCLGFSGTLDGDGHKIIGLYLKSSSTTEYGSYMALFGQINSGGVVKDLGITDSKVLCEAAYIAGICGLNEGTISNCYSAAKIQSSSKQYCFGGICGLNEGTVEGCYNKGEIYFTGGSSYGDTINEIGGVCGRNEGTISACYNTGRVFTTSNTVKIVGGVCGFNVLGTVKDSYNKGEVNGHNYTGGVCGWNYAGTVKTSYNEGTVTGRYSYTGGVCGYSSSTNKSDLILKCYNTGEVTCTYTSALYTCTGGICGYLDGNLIKQCYNTGKVTGFITYGIAGICGYVNTGEIRECYNAGEILGKSIVGGIAGLLNSNSLLENCYNMGTINAVSGYAGGVWASMGNNAASNTMRYCYNIGKIAASGPFPVGEKAGNISNVYYDSDVVATYDTTNSDFAKTTAQLTADTALDDLGFDPDIWTKNDNTSICLYYPDLKNIDGDQPRIIIGAPVPTGLKATAGSRSAALTWDATDGAEKYAVYKYVDGKYTTLTSKLTTNSYTVTGLTNGVKVGFKVKAYANGKWSDACSIVYATPKAPTPTNIKATAGDTKATVTWGAVSGATKYAVYKYIDGKYTCLTTAVTGTSYTVTGLENGTKYGFKVKAYVDQWSGASAMAYATPVANIIPQNVKAKAGNGQATITWSAVSGATKYAVYIYKDGKYTCLKSNITGTSYTVTDLENGVKVGFKVKAYVGKWSGASAMAYATPVASDIPQNVTAFAGDSTAALTWDKVTGAERYAVYIYIDGKYTCLNSNIKSASYIATGLTNGTKYGFKVKAYVNGKWSGASSMAYATPNA